MKRVFAGSFKFVGRRAIGLGAAWLLGASLVYAQAPGFEDPFKNNNPPPANPAPPVPSEPAMPPANPVPEQPGVVPGGEAAPAPVPEGRPDFESAPQPSAPQATPAEEQIMLGRDLLEQGKGDLAIQHFEEATKLAGEAIEKADAFFHLGNALRQLERFDDAIDAYSSAIANNPDDGEFYLRRGIAWFFKGEYGIAWDDFDDASVIFLGTEPTAELWKGLARARQQRWLDAVNEYARAILQNPRYSLAYTNRGLAYLQLDEPDKAVLDFDQAIRNDPRNPVHYFRRGIALTRMGRTKAAVDSYDQAVRLDPNFRDAVRNRDALQGQAGSAGRRSKAAPGIKATSRMQSHASRAI